MLPVDGARVSSKFNENRGNSFHTGVDLAIGAGTPIKTCYGGKVVTATYHSSYGNYVKTSNKLTDGREINELFAHMSKINVKVGQNLNIGDIVGLVGSTGNSTGNHLHYEIKIGGKNVDPMSFTGNVETLPNTGEGNNNNNDSLIGSTVNTIMQFVTSGFIYIVIFVLIIFALLKVYNMDDEAMGALKGIGGM
jgi:murein DD-endopeptidase MepM/ murein hydrolase activator NlpD